MKQQLKIAKNVAKLIGMGAVVSVPTIIGGLISGYNLCVASVQTSKRCKISGFICSSAMFGVSYYVMDRIIDSEIVTDIMDNSLAEIADARDAISEKRKHKNKK